jgi:hypothetical protein
LSEQKKGKKLPFIQVGCTLIWMPKTKLIREIKFLKKLKKSKLKIKKIVPEIINYGIEKDLNGL